MQPSNIDSNAPNTSNYDWVIEKAFIHLNTTAYAFYFYT